MNRIEEMPHRTTQKSNLSQLFLRGKVLFRQLQDVMLTHMAIDIFE